MGTGVQTGNATRRRRFAAAVVVALTAGVLTAIVLGTRSSSSPPAGVKGGSMAGFVSVERHDLVETDTESGTLGYADPQTVYDRLSGTITWLPAVGQVIHPGQTVYAVNGRGVVLFDGALPAYRALTAKDSAGGDILQLNRDLVQMGFADGQITVDDTWQSGTTDAVKRWQASIGEQQSGTIALGRIVFLPGAQRVTQVETTCGSTGGGSGGGPSSGSGSSPTNGCGVAEASATTQASDAELVDLIQSSATTPTTTSPSITSATTQTTTTTPGRATPPSTSESGEQAASAILLTTSTRVVVTVDLAASSQGEAVVGSHVTVELPSGSTVAGTVTGVGSVAQSSSNSNVNGSGGNGSGNSGSSSPATVLVTIRLDRSVGGAGLDQAAVSVNFSQVRANDVLSVPVTALIATSGQSYAVQQASRPYALVAVKTGLFAAGYVQISGGGVRSGLRVTDSQG